MPKLKYKKLHRRFRNRKTKFWKDWDELHKVMHRFPGYFISLLLEFMEKPMSPKEIREAFDKIAMGVAGARRRRNAEKNLDKDIALAIELKVLEEKDGKLFLTPGGREIAEHVQEVVPLFMGYVFCLKTVSIATIGVHILLSIVKLAFGFISRSAGLISDGIDNTVDTISSFLVWLGIKFKREKLVSLFVIVMMFLSVGGIAILSFNKIAHPGPIEEGLIAFIVSAVSGLIMLLLSAYQYTTGKKSSNFAIMCQSIDSRNHFLTSLLVCSGIALSFLAKKHNAPWLYFADAAASIIIGFLILKSAIELSMELVKPGDEPARISHFMQRAHEKVMATIIFTWLKQQLEHAPLREAQLKERFIKKFKEQVPKIFILSGMHYLPESSTDLHRYLKQFVKSKKLLFAEGKYMLPLE